MVHFGPYNPSCNKVGPEVKKKAAPKRPLQVSTELHSLISMMAQDRGFSLEQIVSKAVTQYARAALNTPDGDIQRRYMSAIRDAEQEIKQRYLGEQTRRSAQMRRINDKKRATSSPNTSFSPTLPPPPPSSSRYPVEYRYGFAVPKPPPSSYPTYYPN